MKKIVSIVFALLMTTWWADAANTSVVEASASKGQNPSQGLIRASEGFYYGVTQKGGLYGYGTIYRMSPTGAITVIYQCTSSLPNPYFPLVQGRDGNLYGCVNLLFDGPQFFRMTLTGTITLFPLGQNSSVLGSSGPLVVGPDGNLYGTSYGDTFANNYAGQAGVVFKLTTTGTVTVLAGFDTTNGFDPEGGLILGTDGNFYGACQGAYYEEQEYPYDTGYYPGSVFKVTPAGALTIISLFSGEFGFGPNSPMVRDAQGNLYGTTSGMTDDIYSSLHSIIFKCTPTGIVTTLYAFPDGTYTPTGLSADTSGNLYGATPNGGLYYGYDENSGYSPAGSIFKFNLAISAFSTLFSFYPQTGTSPDGVPLLDGNGNILGTTLENGSTRRIFTPRDRPPSNPPPSTAAGTVFSLTPNGTLRSLAVFPGAGNSSP